MGTAWDEQKQSQCDEDLKPFKRFLKGRLTGVVQVNLVMGGGFILFQMSPVSFKTCNIFYISTWWIILQYFRMFLFSDGFK